MNGNGRSATAEPVDARPLEGRRVVVTRPRAQADTLVAELARRGAEVVECPTIRVEHTDPRPLDDLIERVQPGDLIALTSANAVAALFERLTASGHDARHLASCTIAVIGPATADACRARGLRPTIVAQRHTSAGLATVLPRAATGARAFVVRAHKGRSTLLDELPIRGYETLLVPAYRTVAEHVDADTRQRALAADFVTFTSASTVDHFAALGHVPTFPPAISIGPMTTAAAIDAGLRVVAEACEATVESLAQAVIEAASAGSPSDGASP